MTGPAIEIAIEAQADQRARSESSLGSVRPLRHVGLLAHTPVASLLVDRTGRVTWHNAAAAVLLSTAGESSDRAPYGASESGLVGRRFDRCFDPGDSAPIAAAMEHLARASGPTSERLTVMPARAAGAPTRPVDLHLAPAGDGDLVAQLVDAPPSWGATLDEQRRFRSVLLELSDLSHGHVDEATFYDSFIRGAVAAVPGAQAGSILLRRPGTDEFHFAATVGFDLAALQQRHLRVEQMFRDLATPVASVNRDLADPDLDPETAAWLRTHGRIESIVCNVSAPVFSDGEAVAFVSLDNFDDVDAFDASSTEMTTVLGRLIADLIRRRRLESELRAERESFRHLAHHDALTGLANRRHLEATIDDALAEASSERRPLAVMFIDLDDFKRINDAHGHDAGDRVLLAVADTLRRASRLGDVAGRWGGDEFVMVAPGVPTRADAHRIGQRIIDLLGDEIELPGGDRIRCRLSVGVAWSRDGSEGFDGVLRRADDALYRAKLDGKSTVRTDAA